ncbi:MAG: hypothetical protein M1831_004263 [Alyxoria varia]|nr:MAG: hypothetical protein M1831_004263 [Alyxoria varia]
MSYTKYPYGRYHTPQPSLWDLIRRGRQLQDHERIPAGTWFFSNQSGEAPTLGEWKDRCARDEERTGERDRRKRGRKGRNVFSPRGYEGNATRSYSRDTARKNSEGEEQGKRDGPLGNDEPRRSSDDETAEKRKGGHGSDDGTRENPVSRRGLDAHPSDAGQKSVRPARPESRRGHDPSVHGIGGDRVYPPNTTASRRAYDSRTRSTRDGPSVAQARPDHPPHGRSEPKPESIRSPTVRTYRGPGSTHEHADKKKRDSDVSAPQPRYSPRPPSDSAPARRYTARSSQVSAPQRQYESESARAALTHSRSSSRTLVAGRDEDEYGKSASNEGRRDEG